MRLSLLDDSCHVLYVFCELFIIFTVVLGVRIFIRFLNKIKKD